MYNYLSASMVLFYNILVVNGASGWTRCYHIRCPVSIMTPFDLLYSEFDPHRVPQIMFLCLTYVSISKYQDMFNFIQISINGKSVT